MALEQRVEALEKGLSMVSEHIAQGRAVQCLVRKLAGRTVPSETVSRKGGVADSVEAILRNAEANHQKAVKNMTANSIENGTYSVEYITKIGISRL